MISWVLFSLRMRQKEKLRRRIPDSWNFGWDQGPVLKTFGLNLCRSSLFKKFAKMFPVLHPSCMKENRAEGNALLRVWFISVCSNSEDRRPRLTSLVKSLVNFKIMIACES